MSSGSRVRREWDSPSSGLRLRLAEPSDNLAVAKVHVRSWQAAYRGLLPEEYLDALKPSDRASRYTFGDTSSMAPATTVAMDGQVICGFATTGLSRDSAPSDAGELFALYVDPDWWDHGVGQSLMREARERMATQGCPEGLLWVLVGNERAERFYRLDGWRSDGQRRKVELHGITVDERRYRRPLP